MKKLVMKLLRAYSWCVLKMTVWLSVFAKPVLDWMLELEPKLQEKIDAADEAEKEKTKTISDYVNVKSMMNEEFEAYGLIDTDYKSGSLQAARRNKQDVYRKTKNAATLANNLGDLAQEIDIAVDEFIKNTSVRDQSVGINKSIVEAMKKLSKDLKFENDAHEAIREHKNVNVVSPIEDDGTDAEKQDEIKYFNVEEYNTSVLSNTIDTSINTDVALVEFNPSSTFTLSGEPDLVVEDKPKKKASKRPKGNIKLQSKKPSKTNKTKAAKTKKRK
jgi:hypothetical protein